MFGPIGGPPLPKPAHSNYLSWRRMYDLYATSPNEVGELIAIGGNAIVRIRDSQGKVTKRVIAGKDPLQIEVEGAQFDIVYIAFPDPRGSVQSVDIYVRTVGALSSEKGMNLFHAIEPLFPGTTVWVYLRNDGLFVYDSSFPFVNPFEESSAVPSEEEYRRTQTLTCTYRSGAASCRF